MVAGFFRGLAVWGCAVSNFRNTSEANKIEENSLVKNGREYFLFSVRTPHGRHFTNWMVVVDGKLHDADGIEDDTYGEGEVIPTSPVVSIPAPVDAVDEHLRPILHQMFLTAISERVGFSVDVPMLCEARDAEEIAALKMSNGYRWDVVAHAYLKCSPSVLNLQSNI